MLLAMAKSAKPPLFSWLKVALPGSIKTSFCVFHPWQGEPMGYLMIGMLGLLGLIGLFMIGTLLTTAVSGGAK